MQPVTHTSLHSRDYTVLCFLILVLKVLQGSSNAHILLMALGRLEGWSKGSFAVYSSRLPHPTCHLVIALKPTYGAKISCASFYLTCQGWFHIGCQAPHLVAASLWPIPWYPGYPHTSVITYIWCTPPDHPLNWPLVTLADSVGFLALCLRQDTQDTYYSD